MGNQESIRLKSNGRERICGRWSDDSEEVNLNFGHNLHRVSHLSLRKQRGRRQHEHQTENQTACNSRNEGM